MRGRRGRGGGKSQAMLGRAPREGTGPSSQGRVLGGSPVRLEEAEVARRYRERPCQVGDPDSAHPLVGFHMRAAALGRVSKELEGLGAELSSLGVRPRGGLLVSALPLEGRDLRIGSSRKSGAWEPAVGGKRAGGR